MFTVATLGLLLAIGLLPLFVLVRWFGGSAGVRRNPADVAIYSFAIYLASPLFFGGSQLDAEEAGRSNVGRVGWLCVVTVSFVGLALSRYSRSDRGSRARRTRAVLLAFVASQLLSSLVAGRPLSVNIALPFVMLILVVTEFPHLSPDHALAVARRATLLPVSASLAALALGLPWALLDQPRRTVAPFISTRLTGVFLHPNALGPIAAACVVLVVASRPRLWIVQFAIAGMALWLSDARTMMLAAALGTALVLLHQLRVGPRTRTLMGVGTAGLALLAVVSSWADQRLSSSVDISTLNGRTRIWSIGIDYWRESRLVGVGPRAFDQAFRIQSGMDAAGQAHNQVVQSLAGEGLVGVVILALTLITLFGLCRRAVDHTNGASIALFAVGAALLTVEAPFRVARLSPGLFFLAITLLVSLAGTSALVKSRGPFIEPSVKASAR